MPGGALREAGDAETEEREGRVCAELRGLRGAPPAAALSSERSSYISASLSETQPIPSSESPDFSRKFFSYK